ncbi:GntR family transcriptional regulator [Rothia amarae]|uniref:GntR family transcriptional regulator n=1 Tax=Rothia amarae TaxID=169480 RepID=UPI00092A5F17|nr:HTH-type transcriptional repressor yvoA [Mycobacteroides abscessus subsp. abscessus]
MLTGDKPIFQQLADHITAEILKGTYPEESQIPSINEFAEFFRINPATANKGINILVNQGVIYKKRGIGMFVATGARAILLDEGRQEFIRAFISPLVNEASTLGLSKDDVLAAVTDAFEAKKG